jgi:hypothetical protein
MPFVFSKLYSVVKVCAGKTEAAVAHNAMAAHAVQFSLRDAFTIRFIDGLLGRIDPLN